MQPPPIHAASLDPAHIPIPPSNHRANTIQKLVSRITQFVETAFCWLGVPVFFTGSAVLAKGIFDSLHVIAIQRDTSQLVKEQAFYNILVGGIFAMLGKDLMLGHGIRNSLGVMAWLSVGALRI